VADHLEGPKSYGEATAGSIFLGLGNDPTGQRPKRISDRLIEFFRKLKKIWANLDDGATVEGRVFLRCYRPFSCIGSVRLIGTTGQTFFEGRNGVLNVFAARCLRPSKDRIYELFRSALHASAGGGLCLG